MKVSPNGSLKMCVDDLKQNEAQSARAESTPGYLWWSLRTLNSFACRVRVTVGVSDLLLLCLCDVFRALINSLVC